jgi:hypothetical protein
VITGAGKPAGAGANTHAKQGMCHETTSIFLSFHQIPLPFRERASILQHRPGITGHYGVLPGRAATAKPPPREHFMTTNTDKILKTMFARLLQIEIDDPLLQKLCAVIDSVTERVGGNFDLETVQGQNTFRALLCSMVVHGWGNGMHPYHNPAANQDGNPVEVRVSKDILMSMLDLQALRYVKKDSQGRVKQALFEPDHNARVRQQIDDILAEISQDKWTS